jgi:hypothetical protein
VAPIRKSDAHESEDAPLRAERGAAGFEGATPKATVVERLDGLGQIDSLKNALVRLQTSLPARSHPPMAKVRPCHREKRCVLVCQRASTPIG